MSRFVVIAILVPALALAALAYRAADWDHAEGTAALERGLVDEAALQASRIEDAVLAARDRARESLVVAYAREGRWMGYAPNMGAPGDASGASGDASGASGGASGASGGALGASGDASGSASSASEVPAQDELYTLAVVGGERYEFERGDPERAVDAYSFYLPGISSPRLRALLRFRVARAASMASAPRALQALAPGILRELVDTPQFVDTEEGLPVALLAAARLVEMDRLDRGTCQLSWTRLEEAEPRLSTPALAALAQAILGDELEDLAPDVSERIEARRALEAAVAEAPEILGTADVVLRAGFLLLATEDSVPPGTRPGTRAIRRADFRVPPVGPDRPSGRVVFAGASGAGMDTGLGPSAELAVSEEARAGRAAAPVRLPMGLGREARVVATVLFEDPRAAERLASLDRRRSIFRALAIGFALAIGAGGVALGRYLAKERELSRLRAKLVRNVSHELRTPVTSIRMLSEMLADDSLEDEKTRRYAGLVRAESRRLGRLFDDFVDASRLDRPDEALPTEPVDLREVLRETAAGFAARACEEGVRFEMEGLEEEAPGREGDATAITNAGAVDRTAANLLDNAFKYRRAEGAEVHLTLRVDDGVARISVVDNGPGIPREHRERVFEELFRVCYDDYRVKGSGLGLAIARRLSRKLGGDVTLESEEGKGSTFTLHLPRGVAHA